MKNLLFGLITIVFSCVSSFANDGFPKYSPLLYSPDACACSGMFSSCSGSGSCSCTCGYFSCTCTAQEKQIAVNISISEDQYRNIEKLASTLQELKMHTAVTFLANSIEDLKIKNTTNFEQNRKLFLNELNKMSESNKLKINNFFISINATERV